MLNSQINSLTEKEFKSNDTDATILCYSKCKVTNIEYLIDKVTSFFTYTSRFTCVSVYLTGFCKRRLNGVLFSVREHT